LGLFEVKMKMDFRKIFFEVVAEIELTLLLHLETLDSAAS
jgi:hypothetical protein